MYIYIYIFVCMHVCMYFLKYNWSFLLYTVFSTKPFWKFLRKENLISIAVIASFYFHKNFNHLMSSSTLPCSLLLVIPSEALEPSLEVMPGSPWSCSHLTEFQQLFPISQAQTHQILDPATSLPKMAPSYPMAMFQWGNIPLLSKTWAAINPTTTTTTTFSTQILHMLLRGVL